MAFVEHHKSGTALRIVAVFSLMLVSAACSSSGSSGATATPTAASGSSTASGAKQTPVPIESNPPGDIPDNVAYVLYRNTQGGYQFVHPEGWASVTRGGAASFTDKLNGISVHSARPGSPPSLAGARHEAMVLASTQAAFELRSIKSVKLPGGSGVLIVFRRNS
ncbi:MAG: hypothetical protein JWN96_3581, partial [Mycobacterium sp.]|nr:hypothetical protein [Mycobacterium sp.]